MSRRESCVSSVYTAIYGLRSHDKRVTVHQHACAQPESPPRVAWSGISRIGLVTRGVQEGISGSPAGYPSSRQFGRRSWDPEQVLKNLQTSFRVFPHKVLLPICEVVLLLFLQAHTWVVPTRCWFEMLASFVMGTSTIIRLNRRVPPLRARYHIAESIDQHIQPYILPLGPRLLSPNSRPLASCVASKHVYLRCQVGCER